VIATLPMYDRPETRAANDRLWALFREALGHGPERLTRDGDLHWTNPALLLSQTCSLPFRTSLRGKVMLVAAPVHHLPCPPGTYFSVLMAQGGDQRRTLAEFTGARLAINSPDSHSGWAALEAQARTAGITFRNVLVTGGHCESARAVAEDRADLAAVDAVSWEMIRRWDSFAPLLKVFGQTPPSPALPFVTAPGTDPAPLRLALAKAVAALDRADLEVLCLKGVTNAAPETYFALPLPDPPCLSP